MPSHPPEPALRPGADLLDAGEAKLYMSFPNHTVTFTGAAVVRGVRALVGEMREGPGPTPLVERAARAARLEPAFVDYLLGLLASSRCLYRPGEDDWPDPGTELERHFAAVGDSPAASTRALDDAALVLVAAAQHADALRIALDAGGVARDVLAFAPGTPVDDVEDAVTARTDGAAATLVVWGLPYGAPVARQVNTIALRGTPTLFGSCEGLVGRVGPFVIPGSTPCLECLNDRLLSNAGSDERSRSAAYRLRHAGAVPACGPAHPSLLAALAALLVLEIQDIVLGRPPQTLGGILELSQTERALRRRDVLRAPYCAACALATAPRNVWDVTFDSPMVKDNR